MRLADELDTLATHVRIDFLDTKEEDMCLEKALLSEIVVAQFEQRVAGRPTDEGAVGMEPVLKSQVAVLRAFGVVEDGSARLALLLVSGPVVQVVKSTLQTTSVRVHGSETEHVRSKMPRGTNTSGCHRRPYRRGRMCDRALGGGRGTRAIQAFR